MHRRVGVVAADGELQLAQHVGRLRRVRAHDRQRAAALAVQAHVLGEAVGDEEAQPLGGQRADREGVLLQAVAIALVGQVQEGDQLALLQHRDQRVPLRLRQIHAGRVVAARMQQHDAARRRLRQRLQHRVEAQAAGLGVVVRVAAALQPRALEDGAVVVPGRVAQVDGAVGEVALDEIRAHLQAARRAHALDGRHPVALERLAVGAEQQLLHLGAEIGGAFHRQVGPGAGLLHHGQLGPAHRIQHRDAAVVVEVDADGQVDLLRARVLLEGLVQAEDGIARVGVDVLEHAGNSRLDKRRRPLSPAGPVPTATAPPPAHRYSTTTMPASHHLPHRIT